MNREDELALLEHLEAIPGLDLAMGLANLSGNVIQYHRLVVQLDDLFRDDIGRLAETLSHHGVEQARSLVHSFKGAAGTLGLATLHRGAISLETQLRNTGESVDEETLELARNLIVEMNRFHHFLLQPGAKS